MKKSFIISTFFVVASLSLIGCSKKSETGSAAGGNQEQKVVRINFSTGSLCHAPVHVAM